MGSKCLTFIFKYAILYLDKNCSRRNKMRNRRKRSFADKMFFFFTILLLAMGVFAGTSYLSKVFIKTSQLATVHMVHGDKNTCVNAQDAQGKSISCTVAMKGSYHTEWIAPQTLREN